jgi:hypothetical protein
MTSMFGIAFQRPRLAALTGSALAVLSLTACGAGRQSVVPIQSSATIWVHPLPAAAAWPGGNPNGGSTDFLALFQANSPWPRGIGHTQVIGMYAAWITAVSDQQLQAVVTFLNAHNMGIEIEAPSLQAMPTCGSGVEGYVPYGQSIQTFTLAYLQRLQSMGAQVLFVKVDEPYFFGNVVNDPRSCHFSVPQIAAEVGQYAQLVHAVYPNAAVGDVEPIIAGPYAPDVVTALTQWHDTYQAVTGTPFPFFFADIDFSNPAWPTIVRQIETGTRQSGMRFGIIYIGDQLDLSDAEWAGKTVARFQTYQGANGGQPDYVLFQSWQPHPQLCLPETDPTTFTGVIDAYIDATSDGVLSP